MKICYKPLCSIIIAKTIFVLGGPCSIHSIICRKTVFRTIRRPLDYVEKNTTRQGLRAPPPKRKVKGLGFRVNAVLLPSISQLISRVWVQKRVNPKPYTLNPKTQKNLSLKP